MRCEFKLTEKQHTDTLKVANTLGLSLAAFVRMSLLDKINRMTEQGITVESKALILSKEPQKSVTISEGHE